MKTTRLLIACLIVILVAGGGTLADPPPFNPTEVETIAVLSVADIRKDKSVNLKKLNKVGHRTVKRVLKKSTYTLVFTEDFDACSTSESFSLLRSASKDLM